MPTVIEKPKLPFRRDKIGSPTKSKGGTAALRMAQAAGIHAVQAKALKIRGQIAKLEEKLNALEIREAPKVILPELHDSENGRIDGQKIADFMGTPLKRLSEGFKLSYKAMHRTPSAPAFQKALRPVKRSLELLQQFFGSTEAIRMWLNAPHPDLDGASALETILEGNADAVTLILENAWSGVPV